MSHIMDFERSYWSGHTNDLLDQLPKIEKAASRVKDVEQMVRLRTLASELNLLTHRKGRAARALAPYVAVKGTSVTLSKTALKQLEGSRISPLIAGLLRMQIANVLYRHHQFEEGIVESIAAATHFERNSADQDVFEIFLAKQENRVWRARLEWRQPNQRHKQEAELRDVVTQLLRAYSERRGRDEMRGRLDLCLALALNLHAHLEWIRGHLAPARQWIYRALFLLGSGRARDDIRLAHTLVTAAQIEGSHSSRQFEWAIHLAEEGEKYFRKHGHLFVYRAIIQAARCSIKGGAVEEALRRLTEIDLRDLKDEPSEQCYVEAEMALTKLWALERTEQPSLGLWEERLREAKRLRELFPEDPNGPKRLQAEALLHEARCLIQSKNDRDNGRSLIHKAIRIAEEDQRPKIVAGCSLVLAESYILDNDLVAARAQWEIARDQAAQLESLYISNWVDKLAPRVSGHIEVNAKQLFKDAREEFTRRYVNYHTEAAHEDVQTILRATGLSRANFYRLTDKTKAAK